jgi:methyl acetate hydrolase
MSEVQNAVQNILSTAVDAPDGPAGLVFAAIDKSGRLLINEAAGRKSLATEAKVCTSCESQLKRNPSMS